MNSRIEYKWPSGSAKGWYACTFVGTKTEDDGTITEMLTDADGEVEMHGIALGDISWNVLTICPNCNECSKGKWSCYICPDSSDSEEESHSNELASSDSDNDMMPLAKMIMDERQRNPT